MRRVILINDGWIFEKPGYEPERVNIPHTWNAFDGQDGGNDYFRGTCCYRKSFPVPEFSDTEQLWIEFDGVNSSARVELNGIEIGSHDGGYSTFRFRIDQYTQIENIIEVYADNSANDKVYPQTADFTFYGGIYRNVRLVVLPASHFEFGRYGGKGVDLDTSVKGDGSGHVRIKFNAAGDYDYARFSLLDGNGTVCSVDVPAGLTESELSVGDARLWDGLDDPFLYSCKAQLFKAGIILDCLECVVGFRTIAIDPDKGFFLNGRSYPLRGVSRHQDREDVGNALSNEMHDEDMEIILESGANSIRLAHYQHDQYFYDLCDRKGVLCWAEIPYITKHMPDGVQNTLDQLSELVEQNRNHVSIFCWAISNEITAGGNGDAVYENNRILYEKCHELDKGRPVAMAHAFMLPITDRMVSLPDIAGFNLYYGWYLGSMDGNGPFLDSVHSRYPDLPIGLTEFGCDANPILQTSNPERGDYSEQYQAEYHARLCADIAERPYLWGTFIWNMFDFAADARDEGGTKGKNCKGLVSFDRKIRKDAFYAVKAWYSKEPFVHICGRRYINRCESVTSVTVYSNLSAVELLCNGTSLGKRTGCHSFVFDVVLGEAEASFVLEAKAGYCSDSVELRRVSEPDESYVLESSGTVSNWFEGLELRFPVDAYSINDTVGEILGTDEGRRIVDYVMSLRSAEHEGIAAQVEMTKELMEMTMKDVQLSEIIRRAQIPVSVIVDINNRLNAIARVR